MKILLLGDASNCHQALAVALRNSGHTVTVASDGTRWMQTERDIDLRRRSNNLLGGTELWLRAWWHTLATFKGYDVVAIHNPVFLSLKPEKIRPVFDMLRRRNRSVFLTALQTDSPYVEMCVDPHSPLAYSEFRIGRSISPYCIRQPEIEKAWLSNPLQSHCKHIYENIDGAVSVLYEYQKSLERALPAGKTAYGGIPVDTGSIRPVELPEKPDKIRFFLGRHRHRMALKGTDIMEAALRRAMELHPGKAELIIVENLPYKEYLELLRSAHVVLDQAYSYSPATNALLAMAYGQNVVSGAEDDYYRFIGETGENANRPIINCPTDAGAMTETFVKIMLNPGELRARGRASRDFVVKHNDHMKVAQRFVDFWQGKLNEKAMKTSD